MGQAQKHSYLVARTLSPNSEVNFGEAEFPQPNTVKE
jgi:hypothetical protein